MITGVLLGIFGSWALFALIFAWRALQVAKSTQADLDENYWTKEVIGRTISAKTGSDPIEASQKQDEFLGVDGKDKKAPKALTVFKGLAECAIKNYPDKKTVMRYSSFALDIADKYEKNSDVSEESMNKFKDELVDLLKVVKANEMSDEEIAEKFGLILLKSEFRELLNQTGDTEEIFCESVKELCELLEKNIDNEPIVCCDPKTLRIGFSCVKNRKKYWISIDSSTFKSEKDDFPIKLEFNPKINPEFSTIGFVEKLIEHYKKEKKEKLAMSGFDK